MNGWRAAWAAGLLLPTGPAWAASYVFTTIDIPGSSETRAIGLNDLDQVVGTAKPVGSEAEVGFVWTAGAVTTFQSTAPRDQTSHAAAVGINDHGEIVGTIALVGPPFDEVTRSWAFKVHDGRKSLLPAVPAGTLAVGVAINGNGTIVGNVCEDYCFVSNAFIYRSGVATPLIADGYVKLYATAVNDRGDVVGGAVTTSGEGKGFVYSNGSFSFFSASNPQLPYPTTATYPVSISNRGVITGSFVFNKRPGRYYKSLKERGFVRRADGSFATLDAFGNDYTEVVGVDGKGTEFGYYSRSRGASGLARLVPPDVEQLDYFSAYVHRLGTYYELPDPYRYVSMITGVNDHGSFVGSYRSISDYRVHGFLATCSTGPGTCTP